MATSRCSHPAATRRPGRVAAIVLLAAAGASAPAHLSAQDPPDSAVVELRFFDVGQGDAVLIRAPDGRAVLYDGGGDGARLLAHLDAAGVTSLELVIASHNHADHIGGLPAAIARYRPRYVIENGLPHTTRAYERFLRAIIAAGSERLVPTRRVITLDAVRLTVLPPPEDGPGEQNEHSVGLRIEFGDFSATVLGDSEGAQQRWWLAHHADLLGPVHIHKASHHGSRNGDTRALMERLRPREVVVGVGARNGYGHPDPRVLALYRDVGADVVRTDWHGTVTVLGQPDGSYRVHRERSGISGGAARTLPNSPIVSADRCMYNDFFSARPSLTH